MTVASSSGTANRIFSHGIHKGDWGEVCTCVSPAVKRHDKHRMSSLSSRRASTTLI